MIRGLIFDFDGLILDTEWPVYQSWVELYEEFGTELPFDQWASIIGTSSGEHFNPLDLLEEMVGPLPNRESTRERRRLRELDLVVHQPILPGVEGMLNEARELGLKMGVASSSSYRWVNGHLVRLGLREFFLVVHTSDDVERTKPDPALFNLALKSLDLEPSQAIVFEDSPNGVTAAKSAGIFTVAVPNPLTYQLNLDHADLRLESLAEMSLTEMLGKVNPSSF